MNVLKVEKAEFDNLVNEATRDFEKVKGAVEAAKVQEEKMTEKQCCELNDIQTAYETLAKVLLNF